ncbi:MAG: aminoglycoside phosphotransferase family protein, partial [Microbacteriaceae bacterium]|nr:aminoglycoside phosphotransferase family protein [Microbacteriaceae bacterium]
VAAARAIVTDPARSPDLAPRDRALLDGVLAQLGAEVHASGREQLLHGEPHPGNVLATDAGPLFIDLETCCVGPVEFDLAHAPEAVWTRYPGADAELLLRCRLLVLAIMTSWRWDREDGHPGGRRLGVEWLAQLRADLAASGIRLAAS